MKLKWLAPSGGEQLANRSSTAANHELMTVRAGQQVAFECAAAAQPVPRIRWFRLVASPGGLNARNRNQANGLESAKLLRGGWTASQRLDESAIRSALLQMDALGEPANMHKLEIGSKGKCSRQNGEEDKGRRCIGNR